MINIFERTKKKWHFVTKDAGLRATGATYGRDTRTSRISGEVLSVGCAKKAGLSHCGMVFFYLVHPNR